MNSRYWSVLACWSAGVLPLAAQVYSQNIVGYFNDPLPLGNSLLAKTFGTADDTLNTTFSGVPEAATFTEWDAASQSFLPPSVYDLTTGWSINYSWTYGQGALFYTPTAFTETFVGTVWPDFLNDNNPFVAPLVTGSELQLLGCVVPLAATFYDVMGRDPAAGDTVTTLDPASQAYLTTTFENGAWDHGAPNLAVGHAAFFGSNYATPNVVVPEPTVAALAGVGPVVLGGRRRWRG